jgi:hypothetical protein
MNELSINWLGHELDRGKGKKAASYPPDPVEVEPEPAETWTLH